MNAESNHLIKEENSFIKFVKEVAKYFMEFLDTDFKKVGFLKGIITIPL